MIFISGDRPQDFVSSWGVQSSFTEYEDGWLCALGWETELESRGIEFELIEIVEDEGGV